MIRISNAAIRCRACSNSTNAAFFADVGMYSGSTPTSSSNSSNSPLAKEAIG